MGVQKHSPGCTCCQCVTLHVAVNNNCTAAAESGAAVSAVLGATTVSGTTVSGTVDLALPTAGSWTVTTTKTGRITDVRTVTVACGATVNIFVPLANTADTTTITVTVRGCNSQPLPGASVTITRGSFTFSGTTDSLGHVVWTNAPAGAWSATATRARFTTGTASGTVTCNTAGTGLIQLNPATGYHCGGCADPTGDPLHLTDPVDGSAITLAYTLFGAQDSWCGCQVIGATAYFYELHGGAPTWDLTVAAKSGLGSCAGVTCIPTGIGVQTKQGTVACGTAVPMSAAIPINFSGAGSLLTARWGTGTQTFPVSE